MKLHGILNVGDLRKALDDNNIPDSLELFVGEGCVFRPRFVVTNHAAWFERGSMSRATQDPHGSLLAPKT
jgi:hypothetical protein